MLHGDAPAFPEMAWANSAPLTWSDLKGKVVILFFAAASDGETDGERDQCRDIDKDRAVSGVALIRIEPPGKSQKELRQFADDNTMRYPICLDVKQADGTGGTFAAAFHMKYPSEAVLIDSNGKVAAFGTLRRIRQQAADLAKKGREEGMP